MRQSESAIFTRPSQSSSMLLSQIFSEDHEDQAVEETRDQGNPDRNSTQRVYVQIFIVILSAFGLYLELIWKNVYYNKLNIDVK
jgi:hypothetical protein